MRVVVSRTNKRPQLHLPVLHSSGGAVYPREVAKAKAPVKVAELLASWASVGSSDGASVGSSVGVGLEPMWALVDAAMGPTPAAPLFFGLTGGVRAALASGALAPATLDAFEAGRPHTHLTHHAA